MNRVPLKITRETLYESVWNEPMRKVAERYGISDVALAKTCRRHSIPIPGRGYWQKLAAGRAPPRPPLPEADEEFNEIHIYGGSGREAETPVENEEIAHAVREHTPTAPVVVVGTIEETTPVAQRTFKALKRGRSDERGIVRVNGPGLLSIAATPDAFDRACRIADGFVRACQDQGLITTSRRKDADFDIHFQGETVSFSITEAVTRTERPAKSSRHGDRESALISWYTRPLYDYHPTGRLTFRFDGFGNGIRMSWSDGKIQRLENVLVEAVAGGARLAVVRRQEREKRDAERREWEEAARLRRAKEEQLQAEQARQRDLLRQTKAWAEAEQLRRYIDASETQTAANRLPTESGSAFDAWRIWAHQIADSIDPLSSVNSAESAVQRLEQLLENSPQERNFMAHHRYR